MADNYFREKVGSDKNVAKVDKTASIYYGPCRKSVDLTQSGKTSHNPREIFTNRVLKPETNYILLGEVEKELKFVKEKTQKTQVKQPQQLNVSSLLEELVTSKKWQILNSSTHIYGGTKKRPAPKAPSQTQQHTKHIYQHSKQEIGPAAGKPRRVQNVSNNFTPTQNKFAHNRELPQRPTPGFDDYLNAAEVHKLCQSDIKGTYDTIKWSERSAPLEANFPSPVDSTSPLVLPTLTSTTRPNEITSKTSSQQRRFSDNFILQSKHEDDKSMEMKRSETPGSEGTIKLLPSDIRKHRIWLSLHPGTKAKQTTSGFSYEEDSPSKAALRPISPWNGFHHSKDPFSRSRGQTGYTRFSKGNLDSSKSGWQKKFLKKSRKLCGAHFYIPAPWMAAVIMLNIAIGFILGFIAAWFGATSH